MANYHYIIAGLPDLMLDFESSGYEFDPIHHTIYDLCEAKDRRVIDWLVFGMREMNLNNHFYRTAKNSRNKFIREYFSFDLELRNLQAAYISRKNSLDSSEYIIGNNEVTDLLKNSKAPDFGLSSYAGNSAELIKIFDTENILEREQLLDTLRWRVANEICTFNYFDINVILCFLLKISIVSRWNRLDKKRGSIVFKQLVEEVKGTFKPDNNY